jgi:uncharacterized membrane protein
MVDGLAAINISSDALDTLNAILVFTKHLLALFGSLVILAGSIFVVCQFAFSLLRSRHQMLDFDRARLGIARSIALGLEFIIAADVIQTTTTPDYYAVGILASLAIIRAFLNYFINKELDVLTRREQEKRNQAS